MNKLIFISFFLVSLATLSACGNNTNLPTINSAENPVNIAIETTPNPPVVGDVELVFRISDSQGLPVSGATVDVNADHTDMQGMTMSGLAVDQRDGRYSITANFPMSGNWKLTIYVRKGELDFKKEFEIQIQ
ncbi:MAG: FixH family protein [Chloroflexota bacterium]|nr:MAG: hypothetical protein KatS3mg045_1452 [Bellilinea sp.]